MLISRAGPVSRKSPTEATPSDSLEALGSIPFHSPESASSLPRVLQGISPGLAAALPALLRECPDPDSALMFLDRGLTEWSPETIHLLDRHHELAHYAIVIFGHSQFLGETLIQNPDLLSSFLRERTLGQSFSHDDFQQGLARFRSRTLETDPAPVLARYKRREHVRILLRDALQIAPLAETTAEISALADVLIGAALREAIDNLQVRHGTLWPRRGANPPFAVLSLGKLGGNELNYSSDVDLMYLFEDTAETEVGPLSHREYYVRLAQHLTDILSRVTREGAVFRTDLRLRPEGSQGELAISLGQALHYYTSAAHDWELQALIKARHSAGDEALTRRFIQAVQPSVYRQEVNFLAVKTALSARERMHRRRKLGVSGQAGIDVKIGSGGIRDIEFLVQCLQRVYGGAEPWLRSSGTLFALQKLHDKRHITGQEFEALIIAYEFLRRLEHRLQVRQGRQTHRLPSAAAELRALQRSMAPYSTHQPPVVSFVADVEKRMASVAEIYHRIIYEQHSRERMATADAGFQLRHSPGLQVVDHTNRQILNRLLRDAPVLHEIATQEDLSKAARGNLFRFLTAAFTSSERYAVVLRHPDLVARSLVLLESSDYLTDILVRHPEELVTLAELGEEHVRAGSAYLFESDLVAGRSADPVFAYLAASAAPYNEKLALLRRHFRHRIFAAGARDIVELRDVYTSLGEVTAATEDAFAAAFEIAGAPEGLSVMALGRLGTSEFDVFSDADVLFVCEEDADREQLTPAAWKIVQVLNAYTKEGTVFPVDVRLRPHGGEGELLVSPAQLAPYFEQEAHAWEALTYSKLRFLAGSNSLARRAIAATDCMFQRFEADDGFLEAVRQMRCKLEESETSKPNFKTSKGAIYDVDFLCGFLLVKQKVRDKRGTLRDRLWRCAAAGWLTKADAAQLDHATELLRTADHVARLVLGRSGKWLPSSGNARRVTQTLTSRILQRDFSKGLETELEQTCRDVRATYDRILR